MPRTLRILPLFRHTKAVSRIDRLQVGAWMGARMPSTYIAILIEVFFVYVSAILNFHGSMKQTSVEIMHFVIDLKWGKYEILVCH